MLIDFKLASRQQQLTWISETLHSYPSLFLSDSLRLVAALRKNLSFKWQIQWSDYEWNDQKFTGMQRSLMSSPVIKGHFERGSSLHKGCSQAGQLRGRRPNRLPALGSKWTLVRHYLGIIRIQWTNKQSIHRFSQFWSVFQIKRVICFVLLFFSQRLVLISQVLLKVHKKNWNWNNDLCDHRRNYIIHMQMYRVINVLFLTKLNLAVV